MKRDKIHAHINAMGKRLMTGFNAIARELGVEGYAAGLPPSSFLKFSTPDQRYNELLEYLWYRELFREGVFVILRWFISYSHKESDIDTTLEKAKKALQRALDAAPKEKDKLTPFYW